MMTCRLILLRLSGFKGSFRGCQGFDLFLERLHFGGIDTVVLLACQH